MGFLLPLDDECEALATLKDALAFIDACDPQPQGKNAVGHTHQSECNRNGVTTKKMAHRERVKAELQQLRHEAAAGAVAHEIEGFSCLQSLCWHWVSSKN